MLSPLFALEGYWMEVRDGDARYAHLSAALQLLPVQG